MGFKSFEVSLQFLIMSVSVSADSSHAATLYTRVFTLYRVHSCSSSVLISVSKLWKSGGYKPFFRSTAVFQSEPIAPRSSCSTLTLSFISGWNTTFLNHLGQNRSKAPDIVRQLLLYKAKREIEVLARLCRPKRIIQCILILFRACTG